VDRVLLSPPDTGELEISFVTQAMRSGWIAPAGPDLLAFEVEIAARVGVGHAVGLSSGTSALHLALLSWGVAPGDVIPVSTLTFAATANAIRYVGAQPHFVDCHESTGNIDVQLLDQAVSHLQRNGFRVPAMLPVDLLGKCVDYAQIAEVADRHDVRLLCDAAESLGATFEGQAAGSFGDASVLSFNGNKIMTTSGGGMLTTNDEDLAAHVRKLSTQAREPVLHYEHREIGYNYRLSNLLAALGRAQLQRLDEMLKRRRAWRDGYRALFAQIPGVRILGGESDIEDNCWLTAIVVDSETAGWTGRDLIKALDAADIETRPIWKPMHRQPVFEGCGATLTGVADRLFRDGVTLPSGSAMGDQDFRRVCDAVLAFVDSTGGGSQ